MTHETAVHPLTPEQESLWLDQYLEDVPSRYVESWVYRLTGAVDADAVRWALERIVARHEALRSSFVLRGEAPVQVVRPPAPVPLERVECSAGLLDRELTRLVRRPLDPAESPLRATLVEVTPSVFALVVQLHHLVVDDWALETFEREFEEHYRARVEGRQAVVPPVPLQPGPYAEEQRAAERDPAVTGYWRSILADLPERLGTTLAESGDAPGPGGGCVEFTVGPDLTARVRTECRRLRATPFALTTAVLATLLHQATGASDVIVGTPVSRRDRSDHNLMLAPLSGLLPLRLRLRPELPFEALVREVRSRVLEVLAHKDIPYAEVVRHTRRRGRPQSGRLCRTVVVLDDAAPRRLDLPGVSAGRVYVHSGTAKFDLCLTLVADSGGGRLGFLEFATDLFTAERAEEIVRDFLRLLDRATREPGVPLAELTGPELTDPEPTGHELTGPELTGPELTGPELTDPARREGRDRTEAAR